ncbi:hypothetical protein CULT_1550006 [[Clostridium] ultunense Esp]|nr:hypothetical protein CULT_1550006 [[Clostridium] ultunense Esp]
MEIPSPSRSRYDILTVIDFLMLYCKKAKVESNFCRNLTRMMV